MQTRGVEILNNRRIPQRQRRRLHLLIAVRRRTGCATCCALRCRGDSLHLSKRQSEELVLLMGEKSENVSAGMTVK